MKKISRRQKACKELSVPVRFEKKKLILVLTADAYSNLRLPDFMQYLPHTERKVEEYPDPKLEIILKFITAHVRFQTCMAEHFFMIEPRKIDCAPCYDSD